MAEGRQFGREELLDAFDRIGRAAASHGTILDIAIYGGSALMLASNFRMSTEDVDIRKLQTPWPDWLRAEVEFIGRERGWSPDWLNDAVDFHLSPLADRSADHHEFGTFPRDGAPGLRIWVPSLEYMLALKLKAMRIADPAKGEQEAEDIRRLLRAGNVRTIDEAMAIMGKFFPKSAKDADKQRFFLKHIWPDQENADVTPVYPVVRR